MELERPWWTMLLGDCLFSVETGSENVLVDAFPMLLEARRETMASR